VPLNDDDRARINRFLARSDLSQQDHDAATLAKTGGIREWFDFLEIEERYGGELEGAKALPAPRQPAPEKNEPATTPAPAKPIVETTEEAIDQIIRPHIEEMLSLSKEPHVYFLLSFLRRSNKQPFSSFWIADSLAKEFGWDIKRFRRTRKRLLELGYIETVRKPRTGVLGLYRWK